MNAKFLKGELIISFTKNDFEKLFDNAECNDDYVIKDRDLFFKKITDEVVNSSGVKLEIERALENINEAIIEHKVYDNDDNIEIL